LVTDVPGGAQSTSPQWCSRVQLSLNGSPNGRSNSPERHGLHGRGSLDNRGKLPLHGVLSVELALAEAERLVVVGTVRPRMSMIPSGQTCEPNLREPGSPRSRHP
jgi:hypothetical protein